MCGFFFFTNLFGNERGGFFSFTFINPICKTRSDVGKYVVIYLHVDTLNKFLAYLTVRNERQRPKTSKYRWVSVSNGELKGEGKSLCV